MGFDVLVAELVDKRVELIAMQSAKAVEDVPIERFVSRIVAVDSLVELVGREVVVDDDVGFFRNVVVVIEVACFEPFDEVVIVDDMHRAEVDVGIELVDLSE